MTQSDKSIIAVALVPNAAFVLTLSVWMAWCWSVGQSPFPHGAMPVVMGVCAVVPMATVAFANYLRLRRGAIACGSKVSR
jgi:hypothetical protein